jgi:putative DNA methylase
MTSVATTTSAAITSPLRRLDVVDVDRKARKETRNREVHLPPITTYRWWARRTESINGAIIEAFELGRDGRLLIADPFAGGGVIPLAARLRGHQVYAQELNPWAAAGLVGMLSLPEADKLRTAGERLYQAIKGDLRTAYATTFSDGSEAELAHTFRVAVTSCSHCDNRHRLFPHALISLRVRRERKSPEAVLACPKGHLFVGRADKNCDCSTCGMVVDPNTNYSQRRSIICPECGMTDSLEARATKGDWAWEVVLVERSKGRQREVALATNEEVAVAGSVQWQPKVDLGQIPHGQETRVLIRHGFGRWQDLYPRRQRVILEHLLTLAIQAAADERELSALRLAIIGSAEMAGHLSRWDRYYLKSYEAMAGHRFNLTLLPAEPNVWGASASGRGTVRRRIEALARAAEWLGNRIPSGSRIEGPLPASKTQRPMDPSIDLRVVEGSSEQMTLPDGSVDLVLTDPPYHDDVQYSELSLPLRAWANLHTDHLEAEALVNQALEHNNTNDSYRQLLERIFSEARRTLKDDGHLVFSYANRQPEAWTALFLALEGAGLRATGFTVLHSENEMDVAKRGIRACTLDLLMDLVPISDRRLEPWSPKGFPKTAEGSFLRLVGDQFLEVGRLSDGWSARFMSALRDSEFLTGRESGEMNSAV